MKVEETLQSHIAWKQKLQSYAKKPDHTLEVKEVADDRICELGRWLYGKEAKAICPGHLLEQLIHKHKQFHEEAARLVQCIEDGKGIDEDIDIQSNSRFNAVSNELVSLLLELKKTANV